MNDAFEYFLDASSVTTFILGIITGHDIAIFIGCVGSLLCAINHGQQILERRKNKKNVR